MTDKLDLAEEIAALRRTVSGQSVMLKQVAGAVEKPHHRLEAVELKGKELQLRLEHLENWQLEVSEWQGAISQPSEPAPLQPYANDNNPGDYAPKSRDQVTALLDELEATMMRHKQKIVSGDVWGLIMDLNQLVDRRRNA